MKSIAIVGFGPRGLYALENLIFEASKKNKISDINITIFEKEDELGTGAAWKTNQSDVNWLNITERALQNLPGRPIVQLKNGIIDKLPSYKNWAIENFGEKDFNKADSFPPRKQLGIYLNKRAISLINSLPKENCHVYNSCIHEIVIKDKTLLLKGQDNEFFSFDEIVLTIGHQPTKLDDDLKSFATDGLSKNHHFFIKPYPLSTITNSGVISGSTNVAIRGFGLAMIDVIRGLTIDRGGKFTIVDEQTFKSYFLTSQNIPRKIIPYSLDGLPVVPKPLNATLDAYFTPNNEQLKFFKTEISKVSKSEVKPDGNSFLIDVLASIATTIYQKHPNKKNLANIDDAELKELAVKWLNNNEYKHDLFINLKQKTSCLIKEQILMACNKIPVSFDYCIGQVIRHCQPTLYQAFSHASVDEDVIKEVISFDEKMKRYSYGPPVESMQQIMALYNANILDFSFLENPKITTKEKGWLFEKDELSIKINAIINSVLNAPKIRDVSSPLVSNLLNNKNISPIHSDLGFHTNKDGTLKVSDNDLPKISVLGRLAKGSVIGVDAILECFGSRIKDWAKGIVDRL